MSRVVWLFCALVFSLPIVRPLRFWVLGQIVPVADLLFAALAVGWAVEVARRRRQPRLSRFHVVLAVYLGALAVSALFSEDSRQSLVKLVGVSYLVALSAITFDLVRTSETLKAVMRAWMAGTAVTILAALAGIVAFYAGATDPRTNLVLSDYGTLPPGPYPRIHALFTEANMMSNYLSVSLMIALTMGAIGWLPPLKARLLTGGTWVAAWSTLSPGIGGLFLSHGLWTWFRAPRGGRASRAPLVAAVGVLASLLFLGATLVSPTGGTATLYPSERVFLWRAAADVIRDQPVLGRGPGIDNVRAEWATPDGVHRSVKDPHNVWLSISVQAGAVGLAALILLVAYVGWKGTPRAGDSATTSALRTGLGLAFLGGLCYQGLTGSFEDARHLWVLIGLIVSVDAGLENESSQAI